jgi:hypothetical protein
LDYPPKRTAAASTYTAYKTTARCHQSRVAGLTCLKNVNTMSFIAWKAGLSAF